MGVPQIVIICYSNGVFLAVDFNQSIASKHTKTLIWGKTHVISLQEHMGKLRYVGLNMFELVWTKKVTCWVYLWLYLLAKLKLVNWVRSLLQGIFGWVLQIESVRLMGIPSELGSEYIPSGHLTVCHGKSPCLIGKPYKWAFPMATLNNQRVYIYIYLYIHMYIIIYIYNYNIHMLSMFKNNGCRSTPTCGETTNQMLATCRQIR